MIASSLSVLPTSDSPATDDLALVGHVEAGDDVEQRRLAAARGAHHRDELAAADVEVGAAQRPHGRRVLLERAEHLAAPRRRGRVPTGRTVERWFADGHDVASWVTDRTGCGLVDGCDLSWPNRRGATLDEMLAEILGLGLHGELVPRDVADDDLAVGGELLQPLAQVDGIADDRVLETLVGAEQRGGDIAARHADAQRERRQALRRPFAR